MKSQWVKTLSGFAPADEGAERIWKRTGKGEILLAEFTKPRNLRSFRFYWALIGIIEENLPEGYGNLSREAVSNVVKIGAGYYTPVNIGGVIIPIADSVSFESMKPGVWDEFLPRAISYVNETLIPGIGDEELRSAVNDIINLH